MKKAIAVKNPIYVSFKHYEGCPKCRAVLDGQRKKVGTCPRGHGQFLNRKFLPKEPRKPFTYGKGVKAWENGIMVWDGEKDPRI